MVVLWFRPVEHSGVEMPVPVSYPGVTVQELTSAVRTIAGVATSVTAFVGRTARGPVNTPVTIGSFEAFQQSFGGLWSGAGLGIRSTISIETAAPKPSLYGLRTGMRRRR